LPTKDKKSNHKNAQDKDALIENHKQGETDKKPQQ
jgi:hypothetical protein